MKLKLLVAIAALSSTVVAAQQPLTRVVDDAKAIDRIAEASRHDLPADLLKRILNDDIEALRGHRADDTYQFARYEPMEASRNTESFSIEPSDEGHFTTSEAKGSFVYRVIVSVPSRRMVVTRNRRVWIDHIAIEYMPQNSSVTRTQNVNVQAWLEPGATRPIDVEEIARQVTVRVFSRTDKKSGYGNVDVTLIRARVFDDPASPYADAVASAKAIERALDHNDVPSVRAMAQRMRSDLEPKASAEVTASSSAPDVSAIPPRAETGDITPELQSIEDLLTGSESERRQGLDRLHQLLRRLRGK